MLLILLQLWASTPNAFCKLVEEPQVKHKGELMTLHLDWTPIAQMHTELLLRSCCALYGAQNCGKRILRKPAAMAFVVGSLTPKEIQMFTERKVQVPALLGSCFMTSDGASEIQQLQKQIDNYGMSSVTPDDDATWQAHNPHKKLALLVIKSEMYGTPNQKLELQDILADNLEPILSAYKEEQKWGQTETAAEVASTMDLLQNAYPEMITRATEVYQIAPVHCVAMYRRAMAKAILRRCGKRLDELHTITASDDEITAALELFSTFLITIASTKSPELIALYALESFYSPLIPFEAGLFWVDAVNNQCLRVDKIATEANLYLTTVSKAPTKVPLPAPGVVLTHKTEHRRSKSLSGERADKLRAPQRVASAAADMKTFVRTDLM